MSASRLRNRRLGRWLVPVIAVCIGVPALMMMQGCCSWCVKHCPPPCPPSATTHPIVVVPDDKGQPSYVAPLPRLKVGRGDLVLFVNASEKPVTISANMTFKVFTEGDEVTLKPHEIRCRTISQQAVVGTTVVFKITPLFPPPWYPGPGMDIDH